MRTMFVCRSAARLPKMIDAAARIHSTGCQESGESRNPNQMIEIMATNPPAFDATERKAVTGVGAPSYVSGAQKWNGTAEILNANPPSVRKTATANNGSGWCDAVFAMSDRSVEPLIP